MTDQELQELLDKDNGLLRDKFQRYGRMFLVQKVLGQVTRQQQAAFDALRTVLILEAQGRPYRLKTTPEGFEVIGLDKSAI